MLEFSEEDRSLLEGLVEGALRFPHNFQEEFISIKDYYLRAGIDFMTLESFSGLCAKYGPGYAFTFFNKKIPKPLTDMLESRIAEFSQRYRERINEEAMQLDEFSERQAFIEEGMESFRTSMAHHIFGLYLDLTKQDVSFSLYTK